MEDIDPVMALDQSLIMKQRALYDIMDAEKSEIQQFYANMTVFVTGGSGFLGKLLIEKLLRSCADLKKIYVLIRWKKGKTPLERINEIFTDPLYDELRRRQPNFYEKICAVTGDISELGLALSLQDRSILMEEVNIIFHVAATVRFDEPIKNAVFINVRGTREVFRLAQACKKLRSMVYVSTAYCNCIRKTIEEKFYINSLNYETLIDLVETVEDEKFVKLTPALIEKWPNTYTYTKAMAENVARVMSKDLPVSIFRPAIVTATYKEPAPGWCDTSCIYGPTGVLIGLGLGILKTFLANMSAKVDLVPGDYVNNACIALACRTAQDFDEGKRDTKIYTYCSSKRNAMYWRDIEVNLNYCTWMVSPLTVWYITGYIHSNKIMFFLTSLLFHTIPGYLVDGVARLFGKDLRMRYWYRKTYMFAHIMSYFNLTDWNFEDDNVKGLFSQMSEKDKRYFHFNIETVIWSEYMQFWLLGLRKYIVKDGLKGTRRSVRKQYMYRVFHYMLISLYIYLFYKIIQMMFFCICLVLL